MRVRTRLVFTVMALFAAFVLVRADRAAPPARAAFPGENGLIAFAIAGPGQNHTDIYVANSDGTGERLIIGGPDFESEPAWSADGNKIAFRRQGITSATGAVWTANADGSGQVMVASGLGVSAPTWSPAGSEIAFTRQGGIAKVNVASGATTQITTQAGTFGDIAPEWSPDGSKIVFYGGRGSTPDETDVTIWVVNADGSGLTQLTSGNLIDAGPVWSPDGSEIAFSAGAGSCLGVCVISAAGGARRQVASTNTVGPTVAWSPDGRDILFTRSLGNPAALQLFAANAGGGNERQLTFSPASKVNPDWGPLPGQCHGTPAALASAAASTDDDTDGDNIPDNIENNVTHTDPNCQDTDGDGLLDPWRWTGRIACWGAVRRACTSWAGHRSTRATTRRT